MRLNPQILAFSIGVLAPNFVAGASIVALAWMTLEISGSYEAVGIVFLVGNLTSFFLGPFVGVLLDRYDRRSTFVVGAIIGVCAFAVPAITEAAGVRSVWVFYLVAFMTSIGAGTQGPSIEALLQRISPTEEMPQVAAVRNLLRQLGLVGGAGIAGLLVASSGAQTVFSAAILALIIGALAVRIGLPSHRPALNARRGYFTSMFDGFRFLGRVDILRTGAVIVASWSAGQTVNATLAGYVRELGFDAAVYGIGDACWSVGAFVTALWLARTLRRRQPSERVAILGVGGLGVSLAALSFAPDRLMIFAICAILGAFFSLAKVLSDSHFIVICEKDILGRVRSNLTALSGGLGAFVYLAPTALALPASSMLQGWGALLLVAATVLAVAKR